MTTGPGYDVNIKPDRSKSITMIIKPGAGNPGDQGEAVVKAECTGEQDRVRSVTTRTA